MDLDTKYINQTIGLCLITVSFLWLCTSVPPGLPANIYGLWARAKSTLAEASNSHPLLPLHCHRKLSATIVHYGHLHAWPTKTPKHRNSKEAITMKSSILPAPAFSCWVSAAMGATRWSGHKQGKRKGELATRNTGSRLMKEWLSFIMWCSCEQNDWIPCFCVHALDPESPASLLHVMGNHSQI